MSQPVLIDRKKINYTRKYLYISNSSLVVIRKPREPRFSKSLLKAPIFAQHCFSNVQ